MQEKQVLTCGPWEQDQQLPSYIVQLKADWDQIKILVLCPCQVASQTYCTTGSSVCLTNVTGIQLDM